MAEKTNESTALVPQDQLPDLVGAEKQSQEKAEVGRRRFCLRDELAEVKSLMDGSVTADEKCTAVHRKYQLLARDYKRLERRLVECQRKQLEVMQHRDIIQNEYARVNLAKSKLESLCRELQRHSKAVAEESKQRAREEEEQRREVSAKFQSTINEITLKMQEHHQRNQTLRQENLELAAKLKQLSEQYDAREDQFEKILKQKHLEVQLCEAKLAQQTVAAAEEKENSLAERQYLLVETLEQQKRCEQLSQQEADLRGQLSLYSDKFEEFQKTLTKSNEVFGTFKKEMDKMSKTISTLEREMLMWKNRYEKCNRSLLEMAEERMSHEQTIATLRTKTEKLEKLCRALQAERNELSKKIKKKKPPEESTDDTQDTLPGHHSPIENSTSSPVKDEDPPSSRQRSSSSTDKQTVDSTQTTSQTMEEADSEVTTTTADTPAITLNGDKDNPVEDRGEDAEGGEDGGVAVSCDELPVSLSAKKSVVRNDSEAA